MYKASYNIIFTGLLSMIVAAVLIYFDIRSFVVYAALVAGFFLIGIGILLGFFRMVTDENKDSR